MYARLLPLLLLAACSRAPDMATSPLIGRWNLEHEFSPEQRTKAIANGENAEHWDMWVAAMKKAGKYEEPKQFFELCADGRAVFPVLPSAPWMVRGKVEVVCVMVPKEGRWETVEAEDGALRFRVLDPAQSDSEQDYSARFETPDRLIVSAFDIPISRRAWVRQGPK